MKNITHYLLALAACASLAGQTKKESPFYARLGIVSPDSDFRYFLGNKAFGDLPSLELGYTFQPHPAVGWNLYCQYVSLKGKPIYDYRVRSPWTTANPTPNPAWAENSGMQHSIKAKRLGVDARYKTPFDNLNFFAGIVLSSFDGQRLTNGYVQNFGNVNVPFQLPAKDLDERRWKLGARFGFEYTFDRHWGMTLDYSFSEWFARTGGLGLKPSETGGSYVVKGVNPVNPKWYGASVQYRWGKS